MVKIREFKDYEVYSMLRVPRNIPYVVRCDGRNFHSLTEELKLEKPYDRKFMEIFVNAVKRLFTLDPKPIIGYLFSDEVSLLFLNRGEFGCRVEKIVSLVAASISSSFTIEIIRNYNYEKPVIFDARIIPLVIEDFIDYLAWRQSLCWRNFLNSYAQAILANDGKSSREIQKMLHGLKGRQLLELIEEKIPLNNIPL